MSGLSEVRTKVEQLSIELAEIYARLEIVEGLLMKQMEGGGLRDHSGGLHKVDEPRTPIGYKK